MTQLEWAIQAPTPLCYRLSDLRWWGETSAAESWEDWENWVQMFAYAEDAQHLGAPVGGQAPDSGPRWRKWWPP